jgi:hypothetical protein
VGAFRGRGRRKGDADHFRPLIGDATDSWTFDANGNRTLSGYETGDANQLLSDGTWDYEYDDEGNQTQRTNISTNEIWITAFDHNNRLTKLEHKDSATDPVDYRVVLAYDVGGEKGTFYFLTCSP